MVEKTWLDCLQDWFASSRCKRCGMDYLDVNGSEYCRTCVEDIIDEDSRW